MPYKETIEKLLQESGESKEIVNRYRSLLRSIRHDLNKEDKKQIRAAFNLALDAHRGIRRKTGEPYIFHPLEVARIASKEMGLGTTSIVCALLHDVVEDSHYSLEYLRKEFGDKVADVVDGLTKISGVFDHTDSVQAENFRKMLLTLSKDVRVILIKLCDRLHNMRTLDGMSRKNQLKIASETLFLYAPLAHRLGLYAIKSELEDLSIKYTDQEKYALITQQLQETKSTRDRYIRKFSEPLRMILNQHGIKYELKGRVKSIHSLLKKMDKQQVTLDEVYDLFAIRIIIDSKPDEEKSDCWKVYSLVTDVYYPNVSRMRDWISQPKSNGYESLHTTVMGPEGKWVEVQIRTQRMDEIAEKGYAAHWKYKTGPEARENKQDTGLDRWLERVKEVLENPGPNALDFLDTFKSQLLTEEIFVFTPKGQLRKLPFGATALDFAFDIHTEIGVKCIGAKVNHKLVQLNTPLNNGDQVEVITSEKQTPKEQWLEYAVTTKARNKIKQTLNEEKRKFVNEGKKRLHTHFKSVKQPFNEEQIQTIFKFYHFKNATDLFAAIGKEMIPIDQIDVVSILTEEELKKQLKTNEYPDPLNKTTKDQGIIVGETPDLVYTLATCCNPIPGDDIFGFATISEGIMIHRTNCSKGTALMSNYGYRVIKADWKIQLTESDRMFLAGIKIEGIDDVGIISSLTAIISGDMKVNMKSITVESNGGTFEGTILLYIQDTSHLDEIRNNILEKHKHMKVFRISLTEEQGNRKQ
jgi:GTP pyrophosphokinase